MPAEHSRGLTFADRISPFNQLFFASASGLVTSTTLAFRYTMVAPVDFLKGLPIIACALAIGNDNSVLSDPPVARLRTWQQFAPEQ
jgi:hypothetical protein